MAKKDQIRSHSILAGSILHAVYSFSERLSTIFAFIASGMSSSS